ncbi:hypothetical protein PLICRDRAFT_98512 [Plicaturopsis crispa FD-325 SS-3]|nr:hypothetical protein PLICRDRAFT_98512 [Plicaturopsis crispa FD-325 SS-3]
MIRVSSEGGEDGKARVYIDSPPRYFLLPATAMLVGSMIGVVRGGRSASLRFLAENAHRPPTTKQGWYFYWKTKNYRVMWGALKGGGADAGKLGLTAVGWLAAEEGIKKAGLDDVRELGAGLATAGVFAAVYRLPWKVARRTVAVAVMIGGGLSFMRWGQEKMREQLRVRVAEDGESSEERDSYAKDDVPADKQR